MSADHHLEKELRLRVDEVLHYMWDPIGIAEFVELRDEYDLYVPQVVDLLLQGGTAQEVADQLIYYEEAWIGAAQVNRARAEKVAAVVCAWFEHLGEKSDTEQGCRGGTENA